MKKGQGLSMNTIIIAAIVIIVLIVLILIFTGRMNIFSGEVQSCSRQRGECKDDCGPGEYSVSNTDCGEEFRCCVSLIDDDGSECGNKGGECSPNGFSGTIPGKPKNNGRIDCEVGYTCWTP